MDLINHALSVITELQELNRQGILQRLDDQQRQGLFQELSKLNGTVEVCKAAIAYHNSRLPSSFIREETVPAFDAVSRSPAKPDRNSIFANVFPF